MCFPRTVTSALSEIESNTVNCCCASPSSLDVIIATNRFPHRRGLVAGAVVSGFGAGAFVFNQLQTALANPGNHPVAADGYFAEEEVLAAVPGLLVTLGATYAALLALGAALLLQRAPARRQCRLGVEVMCRRVAAVAAGTVGRRENEEGWVRITTY